MKRIAILVTFFLAAATGFASSANAQRPENLEKRLSVAEQEMARIQRVQAEVTSELQSLAVLKRSLDSKLADLNREGADIANDLKRNAQRRSDAIAADRRKPTAPGIWNYYYSVLIPQIEQERQQILPRVSDYTVRYNRLNESIAMYQSRFQSVRNKSAMLAADATSLQNRLSKPKGEFDAMPKPGVSNKWSPDSMRK